MARKFDWQDIATLRSAAKTKLARAKKKREQAKTAGSAKLHSRLNPTIEGKIPAHLQDRKKILAFNPNAKEYLLKSAARNEAQAKKYTAQAEKMQSILLEAERRPAGVAG